MAYDRGGGASRGGGSASRDQEEAAAQQQGLRDNQLANKRQTGEETSADWVRRSIEKTRGGSGVTRGITTTSWQMRGKSGGGPSGQRGGGVLKAGGTSKRQEQWRRWLTFWRRHLRQRLQGGGHQQRSQHWHHLCYQWKRDFPIKSAANHAYSGGEGKRTWWKWRDICGRERGRDGKLARGWWPNQVKM
jgi:hypothetical protein